MQLSVIIVNYNVCYFLEQCLRSVLRASRDISVEIMVVDNGSVDESRNFLPERFPEVRFIWTESNLGFGKANNLALQQAKGEFILLLNPDTLVPENALATCLAFLELHPEAGAVGMRMFDGRGRYLPESRRGLPDGWTAFFKLSGLTSLFPHHKRIARYYLGHVSSEAIQEVEVLAGAFMMLRRKVYEKAGGFDEAFFMYGEDIDLSYRILKAGYKNYYLPSPGIIHFKGESTTKDLRYTRHFYEAMLIFVRKHYGGGFRLGRLVMELGILLRGTISWFQGLAWNKKRPGTTVVNWRKTGSPESLAELAGIPGEEIIWPTGRLGEADVTAGKATILAVGQAFTLGSALESIRKHPPLASLRFHLAGTAGVIGSDDPASRGEVFLI